MSKEVAGSVRHELASVVKRAPHDCVATCSCGREKSGTAAAKARARMERHVAELNVGLCPTPEKEAHASRETAERSMRGTWNIQHGERAAAGVYRCACGAWHLTKKRGSPTNIEGGTPA